MKNEHNSEYSAYFIKVLQLIFDNDFWSQQVKTYFSGRKGGENSYFGDQQKIPTDIVDLQIQVFEKLIDLKILDANNSGFNFTDYQFTNSEILSILQLLNEQSVIALKKQHCSFGDFFKQKRHLANSERTHQVYEFLTKISIDTLPKIDGLYQEIQFAKVSASKLNL